MLCRTLSHSTAAAALRFRSSHCMVCVWARSNISLGWGGWRTSNLALCRRIHACTRVDSLRGIIHKLVKGFGAFSARQFIFCCRSRTGRQNFARYITNNCFCAAERRCWRQRSSGKSDSHVLHAAFRSWKVREGGITQALTHHDAKRPRKCIMCAHSLAVAADDVEKTAAVCVRVEHLHQMMLFLRQWIRDRPVIILIGGKLIMEPKIQQTSTIGGFSPNVSSFSPKLSVIIFSANFTLSTPHWQVTIFASSSNLLCGRVFRHQKAINAFDFGGAL
jgi:hypothetical protein